jgi:hypothetical protein
MNRADEDMMINARQTLLMGLLPLFACGAQNGLDGRWSHRSPPPLAASGEDMDLHQNGQTVTGNGQYFMEAGPGGQLQVNGAVHGQQLTLTLQRDSGLGATYVAELESANILKGTLTYDSSTPNEGVVFVRPSGVCAMYCIDGNASCTLPNGRCVFSCNQCLCEAEGGRWADGVACP